MNLFHKYGKDGMPPHIKAPKTPKAAKLFKNMTKIVAASQMLSDEKRAIIILQIRTLTSLAPADFDELSLSLMHNLINHCQHLPESSTSFYSQQGGLVDYALNRTEAALELFQQYLLTNNEEDLSKEQQLWQYALLTAGLLQGIGKLYTDYSVTLYDMHGHPLNSWNPLLESFIGKASHYSYELTKEDNDDFRKRINLLLAKLLMPTQGFAWIASNKQVLAVWLALLNEDYYSAGTLGAILIRADAIAIQRYFDNILNKALPGTHQNPYGRIGTFAGGQPESSAEIEQQMGIQFINWLKNALATKSIMVNKAPLFMVPGGLLINPDVFKLFVRENPEFKNWQAVQNGFMSLKVHHLAGERNFAGALNEAARETKTGIIFKNYAIALPARLAKYNEQTGKVDSVSAIELISAAKATALNTSGNWQEIDEKATEQASFKSRLPRGG